MRVAAGPRAGPQQTESGTSQLSWSLNLSCSKPKKHRKHAQATTSEPWMPIQPPNTPTIKPEPKRNPRADMLNKPMTRPRMGKGAEVCTIVCAVLLDVNSAKPATNSKTIAKA